MTTSKRKYLRINCKSRGVNIKTANEEGKAVLVNISTKGCAMVDSSLQAEIEEIVLISFSIQLKLGENKTIEARAKVLRTHPQLAVQFTRIEPETESLILEFFLSEYRELK